MSVSTRTARAVHRPLTVALEREIPGIGRVLNHGVVSTNDLETGEYGLYDATLHTVFVSTRLERVSLTLTLAHELGHVLSQGFCFTPEGSQRSLLLSERSASIPWFKAVVRGDYFQGLHTALHALSEQPSALSLSDRQSHLRYLASHEELFASTVEQVLLRWAGLAPPPPVPPRDPDTYARLLGVLDSQKQGLVALEPHLRDLLQKVSVS